MGVLRALLEGRGLEQSFVDNPKQWLIDMFGGRAPSSGVTVTPTTAMQCSAVYACVRILAETIGSLPRKVYRRRPDGGKEPDTDHPLYPVLHDQPNPEMTAMELFEMLEGHVALRGNAYAEIVRNGAGRVVALWPLHPDRVKVERRDLALVYVVQVPGSSLSVPGQPIRPASEVALPADQVLHGRGLSSDGVLGLSPIQLAAEAIGLTIATERYGAKFFGSGSIPSGVMEHPAKMAKDTKEKLRAEWTELHTGLDNAHRLAILEEGMKWTQVGIQNDHAQFLQTRGFQLADIARIFRIPGVLLGLDDKTSTYASAEQFFLSFVVHTIRPWVVRWEQAFNAKLLTPRERETVFVEHLLDGLLRGDIKTRYEAYAIGRTNGWLNGDDIRGLENMNPMPDGQGAVYLVQGAMIPVGQAGKPMPAPGPAAGRAAVPAAFVGLLEDAYRRLLRKEALAVGRAVKREIEGRGVKAFEAWAREFYAELREEARGALRPILEAQAMLAEHDGDVVEAVEAAVDGYVRAASAALAVPVMTVPPEAISAAVLRHLETWEREQAPILARATIERARVEHAGGAR